MSVANNAVRMALAAAVMLTTWSACSSASAQTTSIGGSLSGPQTFDATSGTAVITGNATLSADTTFNLGFQLNYLVVGGGGGGGVAAYIDDAFTAGGGGGGGGVMSGTTFLSGVADVTIGGGGNGSNDYYNPGDIGGDSTLSTTLLGTITGYGGNGGEANGNGGPSATFNGGTGPGGGGGGAGAVGGDGPKGTGGDGVAWAFEGGSTLYGAGGGGATFGSGGSTGGGYASSSGGGGADTLGAGGGAGDDGGLGGDGGSGTVKLAYLGSQIGTATNGTQSSGTGSAAGYTVVSFTDTGAGSYEVTSAQLASRLAATLTGNLSGSGGLTFAGPGTLTLTGSNSYTGGTTIRSGSIAVTAGGAISHGSADLIIGQSSGDLGALTVNGGSVTNATSFLGYNHDYVGTAEVSSGTWANSADLYVGYDGTGTLNVDGGSVTNSNGWLGYTAGSTGTATVSSGTWATSGDLFVGYNGTGTLTMTGGLVTVGGTLSQGTYGTINLNSGGTLQIGTGSTTGVLGVDALTNNGTLIFSRSDAFGYSGIISGTGAVTKQGAGTLTLTGTSSYTGPTHVDGGSLFVDGRLGNTAVSVASGGLLGGTGTIDGSLTVLAGGTLSPGNSPGILTVDSLSLFAGSYTLMEITGTAASLYDQIVAVGSGGLIYGGQLALTMTGSEAYALNTTFNLFTNFVTRSGSFSSVTLAADGTPYEGLMFSNIGGGVWETGSTGGPLNDYLRFEQSTGNLIVVPEPSTYAMALAGLACGGWHMWRRRRLRG